MGRGAEVRGSSRDLVAVAIHAGKGSQEALKWALENVVAKRQVVILLHIRKKITAIPTPTGEKLPISDVPEEVASMFFEQRDIRTKEMLVPLQCLCNRKRVQFKEIVLDDIDKSMAIVNFAIHQNVDILVVGASSKNLFVRIDVPSFVSKNAPDFCSVFVISKGRICSQRPARHPYAYPVGRPDFIFETYVTPVTYARSEPDNWLYNESAGSSPLVNHARKDRLNRPGTPLNYSYASTCSSPSSIASMNSQSDCSYGDPFMVGKAPNYSQIMHDEYTFSDGSLTSFESKSSCYSHFSSSSSSTGNASLPPHSKQRRRLTQCEDGQEELDLEIRRLKLQLKQSVNLFQDTSTENNHGKLDEKLQKQENPRVYIPAKEIWQADAFIEAAKAVPAFRRYSMGEIEKATDNFSNERKVADGGLGPVFRSALDHNAVVIKILRSDLVQSEDLFHMEVARLSGLYHPNVISFLGVCFEIKCLVYEHTSNGFLEDLLSQAQSASLTWKTRLRIAADVASGLHFLHNSTAKPVGLTPSHVLLSHDLTAKISPFPMKSSPSFFAYIDPECQRTGSMSMESDVYALGVFLLQLITAAPPLGLVRKVGRAVDVCQIRAVADTNVSDGPMEGITELANLALSCTKIVAKDRADLGCIVIPELKWLRDLNLSWQLS